MFWQYVTPWSLSPAKRLHMAKLHTQSQRDEHQEEEDGEQLRHPLELADGRRVRYECEARAALHHLVHLHVQLVSKVA